MMTWLLPWLVLSPFDLWLDQQREISWNQMLANISPKDGHPGAVIASPSREDPNYYYYWVRDGAIVMKELVHKIDPNHPDPSLVKVLKDFSTFSQMNQTLPTQGGIGEPKYHVDGSRYEEPWGRPQNDGPALRALTLIDFYRKLKKVDSEDSFLKLLYDRSLPTQSVIKKDLEFISHHWRDDNFELWEELAGDHFFTRLIQRTALREGAIFARELGDSGAADWYESQAKLLSDALEEHWNSNAKVIVPTLRPHFGTVQKPSFLDTSVILAVLHSRTASAEVLNTNFSILDSRVLSTAALIERAFAGVYAVNHGENQISKVGVAIGRYPEDFYFGGNPWYLTTLAMAEAYHLIAKDLSVLGYFQLDKINQSWIDLVKGSAPHFAFDRNGRITSKDSDWVRLISAVRSHGDGFLRRIQIHLPKDGSMSEQFSRWNGNPLGARNLTWSYASYLSAFRARQHDVKVPLKQ